MCAHSHTSHATPAFASHTSLVQSCSIFRSKSLTSSRPYSTTTTQPRRRRRPHSPTALFIWSNGYEEDSPEDPDDQDTESSDADQPLDENVWSDTFRRPRPGDVSSRDTGTFGAGAFGRPTATADGYGIGAINSDSANPLYSTLRQYSNGPDDIDRLRTMASESASDAFRRIVIGILGTIPTDTYDVVISTDRSGVSRLMQSSLSTGYALRNAEFRMLLNEAVTCSPCREKSTIPDAPNVAKMHDLFTSEPDYMIHVPRRGRVDARGLDGVVRWWDSEREVKQQMTGADYVAKLEAENELLRERLAATQLHDANNNKLMDFMRTLHPEKIAALQADLSGDAVDAFKRVVKSVLGDLSASKVQMTYSTNRDYLSQLTYWCLLVGYCIRNIEKRVEMTKIFQDTASFAEPSLRDVES